MKKVLLSLIFILSAFCGFGQSRADYQTAMTNLQKLYNEAKVESIKKLYGKSADMEAAEKVWNAENMKELTEKYGKLKEFKYIGDKNEGQPANLYKVAFDKKDAVIGIYLDTEGKWLTFSFEKSSPGMERMMRAN